jgi:hypothetical protein
MLDEADFRRVARAFDPVGDIVHHAARRAGGVLRVSRDHQHAFGAVGLEAVEHAGDRGLAVAHGPGHGDVRIAGIAQPALEQLGLAFGMHLQRRTFRQPDLGVLGGRLRRAQVEHEKVQDQPPDRARDFDDARVPEEFAEIAAQGGSRSVLRACRG